MLPDILNNTKAFSFLGITSQQQFADLIAWELFFQRCGSINSMTELGTGRGGMTLYFSLTAAQRRFLFYTYDIESPFVMTSKLSRLLSMDLQFSKLDIFENPLVLIRKFSHPMVLYCDNGDKPREVREFHKYLLQGDYLVVHDYGKEIFEYDIPDGFIPFIENECQALNCLTKFFKKE